MQWKGPRFNTSIELSSIEICLCADSTARRGITETAQITCNNNNNNNNNNGDVIFSSCGNEKYSVFASLNHKRSEV